MRTGVVMFFLFIFVSFAPNTDAIQYHGDADQTTRDVMVCDHMGGTWNHFDRTCESVDN